MRGTAGKKDLAIVGCDYLVKGKLEAFEITSGWLCSRPQNRQQVKNCIVNNTLFASKSMKVCGEPGALPVLVLCSADLSFDVIANFNPARRFGPSVEI